MEEYEYHDDNWDWNYINRDSYDAEEMFEHNNKINSARHPGTSIKTLTALSKDWNSDIRSSVAKNPNAPKEALINLSKDSQGYIRESVAKHLNTPKKALIILSKDYDQIRYNVASNPNTPQDVLTSLSKDKEIYVRKGVALNPNTPQDILITLSKDEYEDSVIRWCVAKNPNTPQEALIKLSKDKDNWIREGVAENPNTPIEILQELSNDKNNKVKEFALKNMEKLSDPSHQSKLIEDKMANNRNTLDSLLKEKGYDRDSGIGKELVTLYNDTQDKLKIELEELKSQIVDIATNDFNER